MIWTFAGQDEAELDARLQRFSPGGRGPHRAAVVEVDEAAARSRAASGRRVVRGVAAKRPRVAFLFTGQGAQYAGMGLAEDPVVASVIARCAEGCPGLAEVIDSGQGLDRTEWTQPGLFAVEVAMSEVWASRGVRPDVVAGHSVGSCAAAVVAGALSLEDGLALVVERGRLMGSLPEGGAMAALRLGVDEIELAPGAELAGLNAPDETVISGSVEGVEATLARHGGTRLKVSHAFHSHRMDPILEAFHGVAAGLGWRPPSCTFLSDHTGAVLADLASPELWRDHIRHPVRWTTVLAALDADVCIEVGPHPILCGLARRADHGATWIPSLRRKRTGVFERAVAEAYVAGLDVASE